LSTLEKIGGSTAASVADVVFVHGLSGDAYETWHLEAEPKTFWPAWLADKHPDVGVWSVGYAAPKTNWRLVSRNRQSTLPLYDRAVQILDLLATAEIGRHNTIFVAHSLGGLIVKQLLRTARDSAGINGAWARIHEHTRSVFFIATPHNGSGLANWAKILGVFVRPSISTRELIRNDAPLRDLRSWYVLNCKNIDTRSFFETRPLYGPTVVVDQGSSDPGAGGPPIPLDEDHISIAKVVDRASHIYRAVNEAITSTIAPKQAADSEGTNWPLPTTSPPIGRNKPAEELISLIADGARKSLLLLGGPAIGKTTLALIAANDSKVGKVFGTRRCLVRVDQEGATTVELLKQSIGRAIGISVAQSGWSKVTAELGRLKSFLLLDNLETAWESQPTEVERCLAELNATPNLTLCATMRGAQRPSQIHWDFVLEVLKLSPPDARKLFLDLSGLSSDFNEEPLNKLLNAMDGVPLALELIAEQAQYTPLDALWREWETRTIAVLKRSRRPLGKLDSLEVSIDLSLSSSRVNEAGYKLFRILGRLPGGLNAESLEALLPDGHFSGASCLRQTRLAYDVGGRIALLAPIREYAKTLALEPSEQRHLAAFYLSLFRRWAPRVGVADTGVGIGILATELGNFEPIVQLALAEGLVDDFMDLISSVADFERFSGLGSPNVLLDIGSFAEIASKFVIAGRAFLRAGEVLLHRSQYAAAQDAFERASVIFEKTDERVSEATCVKCSGDVQLQLGDLKGAKSNFRKALRAYRRSKSAIGEANCWSRLSDIAILENKGVVARKFVGKANDIYAGVPDLLGMANCVLSNAKISLGQDELSGAEDRFRDALKRFEDLGDLEGQGETELGLAAIAEYRQDNAGRKHHLEKALHLFRDLQSPFWVGEAHCRLMLGSTGEVARGHRLKAEEAWNSINRHDLVRRLERIC
jgi:tetratricopeptide (TPR) repeat protein/pimeloyl-ACP methyl ester carboxylesterase